MSGMGLLDYVLPFLLALGILIVVHEFGHYSVARLCGVKVLRFSLGFGKPLLMRRFGPDQTEWVLSAFPLGGYVKMLDEREAPVAAHELHRAFNRQTVWRRIAIVAAGPLANFVLAIVLYWGLYVGGVEELRPRLGPPVAASLAEQAGFADGDVVRSVDGRPVQTWQEFRWELINDALDKRVVVIETINDTREIVFRKLDLSAATVDQDKQDIATQVGLTLQRPKLPAVLGKLSPGGAAEAAGLRGTGDHRRLCRAVRPHGLFPLPQVRGPDQHQPGVLNLLPIPVLDGGHLLYYTVEIIKGGPISGAHHGDRSADRPGPPGDADGIRLLQRHQPSHFRLNSRMNRKLLPGLLVALFAAAPAFAFDPFVVKDIRIEGIQRTEAGTVFNYLPVRSASVHRRQAAEAIRPCSPPASSATSASRPKATSSSSWWTSARRSPRSTFVGVKEFDKDALKKGLREVGLAESRIFDRALLERAEQELKRQYLSRGKYAARSPPPSRRSSATVSASTSTWTRVRSPRSARSASSATKAFEGEDLLDEMQLTTPGLADLVHQERPVFAQKLSADLETCAPST
jgi:membrane-associated protease RseP (regulator of RpoE activity)